MFPDSCLDKTSDAASLSYGPTIVTLLTKPSQSLTTAIVELLSLQDETELAIKAVPELVKLLADKDEVTYTKSKIFYS